MKKFLYYFIIALLLSNLCYSQSGWYEIESGQYSYQMIYFTDISTGYSYGARGMRKTTNSGNNWFVLNNVDTNINYISMVFTSQLTGYVVGDTNINIGKILKTTSGGESWNKIYSLDVQFGFISVFFSSINTGYVVGGQGRIVKTTNAGSNWFTQNSNTLNTLNSVYFINDLTGWVAGEGIVLFTSNGGINWINQFQPPGTVFNSIVFPSSNIGFVAGTHIFKTTNMGVNWYLIDPVSFQEIRSLYFINVNTGYASGHFGTLLKTTNGGTNWITQQSWTIYILWRIIFVNDNTGYCSGSLNSNHIILKTTNGGVSFIKNNSEIPLAFSLYQNYPNPFNPVTKIRFDIPKSTNIKLTVYDISGKELDLLVNESLQPGSYEVEWNGERYASGIYFYRMQAEDYNETRKMILLK